MRASRLLSLMMTLQTRGRSSAPALADELGVSVRTIYRDIDELSALGVPVVGERGPTGGFELLEGWRTRLTGLTASEAEALFFVGLPGPARELGLGDALSAAQLKLLAALPEGWQARAGRVSERFHLDPLGWYRSARRPDHLGLVAAAVWGAQVLEVRYESWKATSWKRLEPLGLVLKSGDWYLVARSERRAEPATYRLTHVLDARATGATFQRPARFDLAQYWASFVAHFERSLAKDRATVRFTAQGLALLRGQDGPLWRALGEGQHRPLADGGAEVDFAFESVSLLSADLLRLGMHAEALAPDALRAHLRQTARGLAALYGDERPPPPERLTIAWTYGKP